MLQYWLEFWIHAPTATQGQYRAEPYPNRVLALVRWTDKWWAYQDSNLEPKDYESSALTVEL